MAGPEWISQAEVTARGGSPAMLEPLLASGHIRARAAFVLYAKNGRQYRGELFIPVDWWSPPWTRRYEADHIRFVPVGPRYRRHAVLAAFGVGYLATEALLSRLAPPEPPVTPKAAPLPGDGGAGKPREKPPVGKGVTKRSRKKGPITEIDLAKRALKALYPKGVPSRSVIKNKPLHGKICEWLKDKGLPTVSYTTAMRAAGRFKDKDR